MSQALYNAKSSSLVMVDEFGKGTTGPEGLALQVGALQKFLNQEEFCPHVLVSTHMQETVEYIPESNLVEHLKMDYTVVNNDIVYLFKVIQGISRSFAVEVAASIGLDHNAVARAKEILEAIKNGETIKSITNVFPKNYSQVEIPNEEFFKNVLIPTPDDV